MSVIAAITTASVIVDFTLFLSYSLLEPYISLNTAAFALSTEKAT